MEVHAVEEKQATSSHKVTINEPVSPASVSSQDLSRPPQILMPPSSQGRAGGKLSVGRGDLDQAIRSMRDGTRRPRPNRPVNKIFVDGRQSRAFD